MPKIEVLGQMVQAVEHRQDTNTHTDRRTLPSALSPYFAKATRSIMIFTQRMCVFTLGQSFKRKV